MELTYPVAPAVAAGYKSLTDIKPATYLFKYLRPNCDERTLQKKISGEHFSKPAPFGQNHLHYLNALAAKSSRGR